MTEKTARHEFRPYILTPSTTTGETAFIRYPTAQRDDAGSQCGADWKTHRKNLAAAEGIELSWRADAARFDKQRAKTGKKKCSHDDWLSPSDPDGRITKLTAGSTDLADKANAVDLDTGLRTYISERLVPQGRTWIDKAVEQRDAFRVNHCRSRSERGKRLLRRRGTVVERTVAHLCETGSGLR
ncbi:MAG: hypothetical protein NTW75_09115, partial [Planctomycetales bacterium]|nr:hypothetical protein [Planctomycetales bacterium]